MIKVIYKRPVESPNDGNLILKDYECEVELIRSSVDGSDLKLKLTDGADVFEETLTVPGEIPSKDGLKDYLLKFNYFYEV